MIAPGQNAAIKESSMISQFIHRLAGLAGYTILKTERYKKLRTFQDYKPSEDGFSELA